jgi:hypothetical protein
METANSLRPMQILLISGLSIVYPDVQLKDAKKNIEKRNRTDREQPRSPQ